MSASSPGAPSGSPSSSNAEPWFVSAFRADYARLYAHRDVPAARREVAWLLEHGVGGRVLDLACGFGRHTLALREGGCDAFGMDLSMDLLRQADRLPADGPLGARPLAGRLVRGDARALPFAAASFDAVTVLFSSFGYFGEAQDRLVLDGAARVLRPGGLLVLDLMNPARIRAGLVPHSVKELEGVRMEERRALEDDGRRVTKEVHLTFPDGRRDHWREDVRMYEPAELDPLLAARGLTVEARRGGFTGEPFAATAERQLVLARRG